MSALRGKSAREQLREARAKIDAAWTAVAEAQDAMAEAGVPREVIEMLSELRLALNDTTAITTVSNILFWGGDHG